MKNLSMEIDVISTVLTLLDAVVGPDSTGSHGSPLNLRMRSTSNKSISKLTPQMLIASKVSKFVLVTVQGESTMLSVPPLTNPKKTY